MILATAFSQEGAEGGGRGQLNFVIQDRAVVCAMGEKVRVSGGSCQSGGPEQRADTFRVSQAWKAKCPELLGATVQFQGNLHWDIPASLAC